MTDDQLTPIEPTADVPPDAQEQNAQQSEDVAAEKADKSVGAKVKRGLQIAFDVVLYLFLAFCIFMLIVSVLSKRDADGAVRMFGHEMRIVTSSSMEKSEYSADVSKFDIKDLKVNSMVFVECIPENDADKQAWYGKLKVGDVLTFKYVIGLSQEVITHRITAISATESGYVIELKGDNRSKDADVSTQTIYTHPEDSRDPDNARFNYVIGKVTGNSTFLGYIVYALRQPLGLALIIIIPCAVIIIWQIVRVVLVLQEDKKKKAQKQLEAAISAAQEHERNSELKDRELEQLKQRLAELEAGGGNADKAANGEQGGEDER